MIERPICPSLPTVADSVVWLVVAVSDFVSETELVLCEVVSELVSV
jgi:hypothetical protein